ncbi:MAG TPA: hypothetical protein VFD49_07280 [Candidatus Dormibacteraeota bacterium]|nr:hypothetical protein [Candidatus Dormibacteraeota bacterium]
MAVAIAGSLVVAVLTLAAASAVHLGVAVPLGVVTVEDPFRDAAVPEAIIAAVLTGGPVSVLGGRSTGRRVALGTTLFATLGVAYGLTVTARDGRIGDVAYHLAVLAVLLTALGLLLVPAGRRARPSRSTGGVR